MSVPQPTVIPTFPPHLDERERQVLDDYEWALRDEEVQKKYAGRFVAVYKRRVWGVGDTHGEAYRAALGEPGAPPGREFFAKVYIEGTPLPEKQA